MKEAERWRLQGGRKRLEFGEQMFGCDYRKNTTILLYLIVIISETICICYIFNFISIRIAYYYMAICIKTKVSNFNTLVIHVYGHLCLCT